MGESDSGGKHTMLLEFTPSREIKCPQCGAIVTTISAQCMIAMKLTDVDKMVNAATATMVAETKTLTMVPCGHGVGRK